MLNLELHTQGHTHTHSTLTQNINNLPANEMDTNNSNNNQT